MKLHSQLGCHQATKILVVAKLCGVDIEYPPYDPAILKSKDFGAKSPLKKLPVLETPQGAISEADASIRYLARTCSSPLYNGTPEQLVEVDTWLDINKSELEKGVCEWMGAVLGHHAFDEHRHTAAVAEVKKVLFALEQKLKTRQFVAADHLTIADIAIASALLLPYRLVFDEKFRKPLSHVNAWFAKVTDLPEFVAVSGKQRLCVTELKPLAPVADPHAEEHKKPAKKEETKKEAPKKKEAADDEEEEHQEKKGPNPLDLLPPSTFVLDDWKRLYANTKNKHEVIGKFWETYENEGWSLWILKYQKAEGEGEVLYMTNNLLSGFIQRLDHFRRYSFGSLGVYGDEPQLEIEGVLMWRGQEVTQELKDHPSFEYYDRTRVDPHNAEHRQIVEEFWCNKEENDLVRGKKVREWRSFL